MFSTIKAARLLGWTSLAVGATELIGTRWLERVLGVDRQELLIKSYGVREVVAGVILLNEPGLSKRLVAGLWGRVAGDAVDLATLAAAGKVTRRLEGVRQVSAIVAGVTAMDIVVALLRHRDLQKAARVSAAARRRVKVSTAKPSAMQRHDETSFVPAANDLETGSVANS